MRTMFKMTAIAAAIAAAGVAGTAHAGDISFYGKGHVSLANTTKDATSDGMWVRDHSSRFGIKGSVDLGDGMSGIFGHEVTLDFARDGGSYTDERNTYVGLKGSFGSVKLGNHDMPAKMSLGKADPWGDTYADYNAVIDTDTRQAGVVLYQNRFGDVGVAVGYAPAGAATANMGASVDFKAGPVDASLAYESNSGGTATTGARVGLDFGAGNVQLVYENDTATNYFLSGTFKMSDKTKVKASYGKNDGATRDMMAAGVSHKMAKALEVYGLYASGDLKGMAADASAIALGVVYKF